MKAEATGDKVCTVGPVVTGMVGGKVKSEPSKVFVGTNETLVLPPVNVATPEVIKLAEMLLMNEGLDNVVVVAGKTTDGVASVGLLVLVLLRGLTGELLFIDSEELLHWDTCLLEHIV